MMSLKQKGMPPKASTNAKSRSQKATTIKHNESSISNRYLVKTERECIYKKPVQHNKRGYVCTVYARMLTVCRLITHTPRRSSISSQTVCNIHPQSSTYRICPQHQAAADMRSKKIYGSRTHSVIYSKDISTSLSRPNSSSSSAQGLLPDEAAAAPTPAPTPAPAPAAAVVAPYEGVVAAERAKEGRASAEEVGGPLEGEEVQALLPSSG